MRWQVRMTDDAETRLIADIQSGVLTREDRVVIGKWIDMVEERGLEAAQADRTWRDHELDGKWVGHRAISFSIVGRVIYRIEKNKVIVRVVRVTHDHDYS